MAKQIDDGGPRLALYGAVAEQTASLIIRRYSTSFGLAARMLGPAIRQPVENIYAAYRHNRFNAARYGLSGEWIDVKTGDRCAIGQMICRTIDGLADEADALGTRAPLDALYRSASSRLNDADTLRAIHVETQSFSDVAHRQADLWATSPPG